VIDGNLLMTDVFLDVAVGFAYNGVTFSLPPHNLISYAGPANWPNIPEPLLIVVHIGFHRKLSLDELLVS